MALVVLLQGCGTGEGAAPSREESSAQALSFVRALYDEYAEMFRDCAFFHIGCDEHFSGTAEEKTAYINDISSYMLPVLCAFAFG